MVGRECLHPGSHCVGGWWCVCVYRGASQYLLCNFSLPPSVSTEVGMPPRASKNLTLRVLLSPETKPSTSARTGGITRLGSKQTSPLSAVTLPSPTPRDVQAPKTEPSWRFSDELLLGLPSWQMSHLSWSANRQKVSFLKRTCDWKLSNC